MNCANAATKRCGSMRFPTFSLFRGATSPKRSPSKACPTNTGSGATMWTSRSIRAGNWSASSRPAEERRILVELSTWFIGSDKVVQSVPEVNGFDDFIRTWDQTIAFLEQQGLMDTILFIDLLNEYPFWNGLNWLKKQRKRPGNRRSIRRRVSRTYKIIATWGLPLAGGHITSTSPAGC